MFTEREILLKIVNKEPEGLPGLFHRHGALFHEGLIRFFGDAGPAQTEHLARVIRDAAEDLRQERFDDLQETFYNWILRKTWSTLMAIRLEEAGMADVDPQVLYESADRLNEAALPEEVRKRYQDLLAASELCRDLLAKCIDIPLEVRHAGASYPESFDAVIAAVLEKVE